MWSLSLTLSRLRGDGVRVHSCRLSRAIQVFLRFFADILCNCSLPPGIAGGQGPTGYGWTRGSDRESTSIEEQATSSPVSSLPCPLRPISRAEWHSACLACTARGLLGRLPPATRSRRRREAASRQGAACGIFQWQKQREQAIACCANFKTSSLACSVYNERETRRIPDL